MSPELLMLLPLRQSFAQGVIVSHVLAFWTTLLTEFKEGQQDIDLHSAESKEIIILNTLSIELNSDANKSRKYLGPEYHEKHLKNTCKVLSSAKLLSAENSQKRMVWF